VIVKEEIIIVIRRREGNFKAEVWFSACHNMTLFIYLFYFISIYPI
jgi:hypothetical protein